jgi:hypothetical protein
VCVGVGLCEGIQLCGISFVEGTSGGQQISSCSTFHLSLAGTYFRVSRTQELYVFDVQLMRLLVRVR